MWCGSDVAQGCSTGTDEEKKARRPAEGQGGWTRGPHPARVGRRMWQSLSLITHTHTRADVTCKDPEDPRILDTRPPPISARLLRLTRAALCFVRLPSHRIQGNDVRRRRRGGLLRTDKRTTKSRYARPIPIGAYLNGVVSRGLRLLTCFNTTFDIFVEIIGDMIITWIIIKVIRRCSHCYYSVCTV